MARSPLSGIGESAAGMAGGQPAPEAEQAPEAEPYGAQAEASH